MMKISLLRILYPELESKVEQKRMAGKVDGVIHLDLQMPNSIRISIDVASAIPLFMSNLLQMLMNLLI